MVNRKKTAPKKPTKPFSWRTAMYIGAATLAAIILLAQACLDVHFWRIARYPSGEPITSMIIQSIRGVTKPAVIDPVTKRVYLPDASLALPPYPQNMPDIEYAYSPSFDGTDAEANVTLTGAVSVGISKLLNAESRGVQQHDASILFTAVPEAQACTRGVHVVFGSKTTYDHLQFTKTLADGRTIRAYTEAQKCAYDLRPLVEYLRGVQSY